MELDIILTFVIFHSVKLVKNTNLFSSVAVIMEQMGNTGLIKNLTYCKVFVVVLKISPGFIGIL